MLNIEQIKNIIESKYEDLKIENHFDNLYTFKFDFKKDKEKQLIKWKEITLDLKEDKISYEEKGETDFECYNYNITDKRFEIKNDAIELKHYLDIEITKQDMIDWLNTFSKEFNSFYDIPTKTYCELYVYIKEKSLCLTVSIDEKNGDIFTATNSQEYWQLYQIIKNLKG